MNDKLHKHVNILFAAAPKNQKAEEIKEELLTNLNDKYDDLLANGYDSTAAFHLALSGIGDIDELLKECGEPAQSPAQPDETPMASAAAPVVRKKVSAVLLVLLAVFLIVGVPFILLMLLIPMPGVVHDPRIADHGAVVAEAESARILFFPFLLLPFICLALGIGLIVYAIVHSVKGGRDETIPVPWETSSPQTASPTAFGHLTKEDMAFKRIVAGILGIVLGVFGVHKFYLGFVGTGLIMLFVTVFSFGVLVPVTWAIGFIEGILYLFKSDRDFYRDYEIGRRNWF